MSNGKLVHVFAKTALNCARKLNIKCQEANISIPNPSIGFDPPVPETETGYFNIHEVDDEKRGKFYRGSKTLNNKSIIRTAYTALDCAKRLNFACREAGFPIPNPDVGFMKAIRKNVPIFKKPAKGVHLGKARTKIILEH